MYWTWKELDTMWRHPEWTAEELHEIIPRHSARGIRQQRMRSGRFRPSAVPLCCRCEERPVWMESQKARRYELCKGCFIEEERRRLEDEAGYAALRQMEQRRRKNG